MAVQAHSLTGTATRVRYVVLAFAGALSMITYLDRVAIASAALRRDGFY